MLTTPGTISTNRTRSCCYWAPNVNFFSFSTLDFFDDLEIFRDIFDGYIGFDKPLAIFPFKDFCGKNFCNTVLAYKSVFSDKHFRQFTQTRKCELLKISINLGITKTNFKLIVFRFILHHLEPHKAGGFVGVVFCPICTYFVRVSYRLAKSTVITPSLLAVMGYCIWNG